MIALGLCQAHYQLLLIILVEDFTIVIEQILNTQDRDVQILNAQDTDASCLKHI